MDTTAVLILVIVAPIIGGAFAVAKVLAAYWLKKHLKDQELAAQLSAAFGNALGAMQQGVNKMVIPPDPAIQRAVPDRLVPGVQYVVDNAEEALERWPMSPEKIAGKLVAREGVAEIASNLAVSGSSVPVAVPPMTPAAEVSETVRLNQAEAALHIEGA